jgi:hypothetical protein
MNPATTPGPQAAQRQGASVNPCNQGEMPVARKSGPCAAWCGARSSNQDTPAILAACPDTYGFYASMISRGGRGLPFVCPSLGTACTRPWAYSDLGIYRIGGRCEPTGERPLDNVLR